MRCFEKISFAQFKKDICDNIDLYNEYELPKRATLKSAGYDFKAIEDITIKKGEILKIPTGVRVRLNDDEFLGVYVRSKMGCKYNIRMCNQVGIIDADYYNNVSNEGHIFVFLQNEGDLDVVIKKGEHFVQGIKQKFMICDNEEVVTKTREGGFGSTDRKEE